MDYNDFLTWKEKCFLHPQYEISFPVNWDMKFSGKDKLIVEIGFGNGAFLKELAQDNEKNLIIGFDISMESCVKAIKICQKSNLENIRIIQNNAKHMLRELFAANSVDKIFMNFPDPWPKKKHSVKRTINEGFLEILGSVLKLKGEFELVTDQGWYAEESKQLFEDSSLFSVKEFQKNTVRKFQTKYEKKWLALKRDVSRLLIEKKEFQPVNRIFEGEDMPHVILKKELDNEKIISSLNNLEIKHEKFLFKIKEIYENESHERFLLKTIAVDGEQQQKFFIVIQKRTDNWLIKLDDLTQPFRTPAVKFAVFEVGRILNGQ
ncbi:MAG: tRNA (guanosine(46)-N7)-methyltransferase TrmB [Calditrichia bacterium]|nr:tRNA (guanosine(46)-N7)-methyltransferase TrmB [Calditrichia bacterium]